MFLIIVSRDFDLVAIQFLCSPNFDQFHQHSRKKGSLCCATIWAFSNIESDIRKFGLRFEVEIY